MTDIKQPIGNELKYDWAQMDGKFARIESSPGFNPESLTLSLTLNLTLNLLII